MIIFRIIFLCSVLSGCTLGTKYEPPSMDIPCEWQSPISAGMGNELPDDFLWWQSFNDPVLDSLIERASLQNLDLHIAMMRILEARRTLDAGSSSRYPHLDASVTYGYAQFNQNTLNKLLGTNCNEKHTGRRNLNFFEAGFDADWEIDLFGMHEHEINALQAKSEALEEAFSNVWVTLSAEVARNYVELRGLQHQLQILRQNVEDQNDTLTLTNSLITAGFSGSVDNKQAEEQLHVLSAQIPQVELHSKMAVHRLSILLGYAPGELYAELSPAQAIPALPLCKPIGIPSELLRRRPDIRQAERELAAATESTDSAIAALFPRISLYGFIGDIAALCSGNGFAWCAGPQLLMPIFNSRMLEQDVCINKIRTKQALYQYQKTVLEALEEVENAIASFHSELERNAFLEKAKQSSQEVDELTQGLYQQGLKSYLEVLTVNRTFLDNENTYNQSQVALLTNYIALYKALGGGWSIFIPPSD